ncbi:hypothetical protein LJR029_004922 [Caballeronia sp. LjRoot29]|uniref:trypco2 family protein n=1 Tax=Caballeronia sp. LjRoot29 TaxID=3342315 RepID=UPI003ECF11A7
MPPEESSIPLARVIADLRTELLAALKDGVGRELQFRLQPIELELKLGVTKSVDGNGGVKFWVMELGAKGSYESAATHTLKLVLEPVGPNGQSPKISAKFEDPSPPAGNG